LLHYKEKNRKKEEAYPWKAGASSGHITNLKQSILETFDIYGGTNLGPFFVYFQTLPLSKGGMSFYPLYLEALNFTKMDYKIGP
jgi:hypothetical protein